MSMVKFALFAALLLGSTLSYGGLILDPTGTRVVGAQIEFQGEDLRFDFSGDSFAELMANDQYQFVDLSYPLTVAIGEAFLNTAFERSPTAVEGCTDNFCRIRLFVEPTDRQGVAFLSTNQINISTYDVPTYSGIGAAVDSTNFRFGGHTFAALRRAQPVSEPGIFGMLMLGLVALVRRRSMFHGRG